MPTQKAKARTRSPIVEQLYDMLMYDIEPELMTSMIPELDRVYADEAKEEKKERAARYAKAIQTFNERLAKLLTLWKQELLAFREQAFASAKATLGREEQEKLSEIERSIEEQ